jgi:cardiolipin synthase
VAHVARVKPERAAPAATILHHVILCMARQRLWIQNPYFLPQAKAITALAAAVQLFEYPDTLLHQSVLTMDSAWYTIGSSNFDDRSFKINDEITLGLLDSGLARRLEKIFECDMRRCVERDLAAWRQRGTAHRLLERTLQPLKEQL